MTDDADRQLILDRRWRHRDTCRECAEYYETGTTRAPSHDGSPSCESGSIASGGKRAHCTCDACF